MLSDSFSTTKLSIRKESFSSYFKRLPFHWQQQHSCFPFRLLHFHLKMRCCYQSLNFTVCFHYGWNFPLLIQSCTALLLYWFAWLGCELRAFRGTEIPWDTADVHEDSYYEEITDIEKKKALLSIYLITVPNNSRVGWTATTVEWGWKMHI